jgi:hypothetical protein
MEADFFCLRKIWQAGRLWFCTASTQIEEEDYVCMVLLLKRLLRVFTADTGALFIHCQRLFADQERRGV